MPSIRGFLVALMCLLLVIPPGSSYSQTAPSGSPAFRPPRSSRPAYSSIKIQGDQRILHALNRFTFGPRPGDLDAVRSIGLDRWFNEQLHPAKLDEIALEASLADYPAMQWNSEDLLRRLPSNAVIRQAINGKIPIPDRGILHAVYVDQVFRLTQKQQEKQNKADPAPADASMNGDAPTKTMDSLASDVDKSEPAKMDSPILRAPDPLAADPDLLDKVLALPPQQRVAHLVSMQPAEADAFFRGLRGPQRAALVADMQPELKETIGALENPERTVVVELIAQRLTRDIVSSAQLQEVMTDFWLNHFNVFLRKNPAMPYYLVSYERDIVRPRALGKFEDLLESVAHSPAMLLYLDNAASTGPDSFAARRMQMNAWRNPNPKKNRSGLNENYARELMELHTLGVNGGYTQADVIQVARILSGWTVDRPQRGGEFRFDPNRHEPGTKKVMGRKFKENGEREGLELLHFLATRPATAHFISQQLAVRFVSDDPPASLVDRMEKAWLSSDGDISAVLRTLFYSPEFWSTDTYRAKVKTPLEYVVSAVRASDAQVTNLRPLANALREMGMPLYGAIPPTGYKWDAADWVSTASLVNRMNFALALAANRLPGITTKWTPTSPAGIASTPESEESRLEHLLLPGRTSQTTRSAVLQQSEAQNNTQNHTQPMQVAEEGPSRNRTQPQNDQILAGLLLGSPEFQRR